MNISAFKVVMIRNDQMCIYGGTLYLLFSAPIIFKSNYCVQKHLLMKENTIKGILIPFFEPINYERENLHIGSLFLIHYFNMQRYY